MKTTVFIIAAATDTKRAIAYWRKHRQTQEIILLPTSLISLNLFSKHQIPFMLLDQIITLNSRFDRLASLPFRLSQNFVRKFAVIDKGVNLSQLFVDVIQFKLFQLLNQYHVIRQVIKKFKPQKLFISPHSFNPEIVKFLSRKSHRSVKFFNSQPPTFLLINRLNHLKFIIGHPSLWRYLSSSQFAPAPLTKSQKRILLFSNGIHLLGYAGVIHALNQSSQVQLQVIHDKTNFLDIFYIKKAGIPTTPLPRELTSQEKIICTKLKLKLAKKFKSFIPRSNLDTFTHRVIKGVIAHDLTPIIAKYLKAKRLIARYQPHLVVTTHDPGSSALAFVLPARASHIKTTVLLHGLPSQNHYFFSDSQIVWGKRMKSWLTQQGVAASRLKLGSYPIHETYQSYFADKKQSNSTPPIIGIIVTGHGHYEWYQATFFEHLFKELQKINHPFQLLVRLHPMQQFNGLEALAQVHQLKVKIDRSLLLEEFVAKTDIVITQESTAAIIPLIAHKPTILINPRQLLINQSFLTLTHAYLKIGKWSHLPPLMTKLLQTKKIDPVYIQTQDRFLADYCNFGQKDISTHISQQLINT